METTTSKIMSSPVDSRTGLVPGVATLAIDVVARTQSTALGVMQDVRGELRLVVDASLDLAEKTIGSFFRIARKLTSRVDDAVAGTITGAERLAEQTGRSMRESTRSATDLAGTAIDGVLGRLASA